nr:MAG TPA: hypothetical protein [Caudoviricetes sp.]DAY73217.1 MAG TPA: hypothetical protein [Caudoviricetes sp.]
MSLWISDKITQVTKNTMILTIIMMSNLCKETM